MESRCENCIIRQLNALKALDKNELKRISDTKISKNIKKGDFLFEEGEKLNGVFCVRNGVSKLSKMSDNGKDQIIKIATKGEVLGQRSVISEESTNLSAIALNDMEVCFIPKTELAESVNTNPNFTKELLLQMATDLKIADNIIVNMAQKNVRQRISELLLYLEDTFNIDDEGFIGMVFTREDIAGIVGTAKEACIRALSKLNKESLITIKGKRIKLDNKTKLQAIVDGLAN
ncbi:Crp/Fnr family transcriptional regulator [Aurantibacter sp.]|uniref:Crp/Fnr family transcriptional regulator n=1 Tax=Aurantibacter sp. TaxID=2807103 RepID=UPI0035C84930